jgi:hypothetical protein
MIDDLATVDLDIAAVEHGYRRPPGPGYALNVTVGYTKNLMGGLFPRSS